MTDQERFRWKGFAESMKELFESWRHQDMEQSIARQVAFRHRGRMPEPPEVTAKEIEEDCARIDRLSKLVREYIKEVVIFFPKDELADLQIEIERRLGQFGSLHWTPDDCRDLRPGRSDEELAGDLDMVESKLRDILTERGFGVLDQLLPPVPTKE